MATLRVATAGDENRFATACRRWLASTTSRGQPVDILDLGNPDAERHFGGHNGFGVAVTTGAPAAYRMGLGAMGQWWLARGSEDVEVVWNQRGT